VGNSYTVTKFSAVRITGVTLDDMYSNAMGVYLPLDRDGDNVVDLLDGRPIYIQRDIRTTQPALNEEDVGVRQDRFYLYYRYELGGWAIDTVIGSEQAILFCTTDVAMAHELHGLRSWKRIEGKGFIPDRRIQLLDLAHEESSVTSSDFSPPQARMEMLIPGSQQSVQNHGNLEPSGHKCPQGIPPPLQHTLSVENKMNYIQRIPLSDFFSGYVINKDNNNFCLNILNYVYMKKMHQQQQVNFVMSKLRPASSVLGDVTAIATYSLLVLSAQNAPLASF
jgi:hypothetical protein